MRDVSEASSLASPPCANINAVAPLSLTFTGTGSKEPLTITAMHLETLLLNGGATYLLKNIQIDSQQSVEFLIDYQRQIKVAELKIKIVFGMITGSQ